VKQVLDSFFDEFGKPYHPAVLIISEDAPSQVRQSLDALVSFRNGVALPILLRARSAMIRGRGSLDPTWSDTFDFHPAQVNTSGRMIIQSPALNSLVSDTARIRYGHSPELALSGQRLWRDSYLFHAIGKAWKRRYKRPMKAERFGDRLFRSLEVAYAACAVATKNQGSHNEYGTEIAQWVSAIEILSLPDRSHADLDGVLELLGRNVGRRATNKKRFRAKVGRKSRSLTALQRGYTYLYRARNRFLHGNPIGPTSLLTLSRTRRVGLPRLAAIIYRAALVAYLSRRYPYKITTLRELARRPNEMFDNDGYERALAELFGYSFV
jgi:hypothetical protein